MDAIMLELGKFGVELWESFKAAAVPVLVPALVGVIVSALAWLKRKLDTAVLPLIVDTEARSLAAVARGETKTPGSLKFADVAASAKSELGKTWAGKAALAMGVKHSIETLKPVTDALAAVVVKNSVQPLGPGASGEHVITIPRNDPPPIPRPSGEIESWGEIDLPKDDATLDDGDAQ